MSIHQQAAAHLLERLMKDRIYAKTISTFDLRPAREHADV